MNKTINSPYGTEDFLLGKISRIAIAKSIAQAELWPMKGNKEVIKACDKSYYWKHPIWYANQEFRRLYGYRVRSGLTKGI